MKRDYKLFIKDILDCIRKIEEFAGDMSFEEFVRDEKTKSAVVREIEVMGEATKNIPKAIRERHKDIPWGDMTGMRDKIIHFYFGVDYEIIWKVVKKRLPEIKSMIEGILKEMDAEEKK
ncbi:MAG: DUF86 domain-containing protein [bacterium]